jgi:hypothetical protein
MTDLCFCTAVLFKRIYFGGGVDVMIATFGDFRKFLAKKVMLKTNVLINFVLK